MVTIQETEICDGIRAAIKRSKSLNKSILVSEVHKIDMVDPLSFFYAGKELFSGERFFWKNPSNDEVIVGLGTSHKIDSTQANDRFQFVQHTWEKLKTDSLIFQQEGVQAVGPTIFGGFTFDPHKIKTNLWSNFSDTQFHLPKYMLSILYGQAYLTTNVICKNSDSEAVISILLQERAELIARVKNQFSRRQSPLLKMEEKNPEKWKASIDKLIADLKEGTLKKVVLARELRLYFQQPIYIEPVLQQLLSAQKESFVFAFESNHDCFIGASPERLVKKDGPILFSTCLAGSAPRGKTSEEDEALGKALLADDKNLNEHRFVVEMIKQAMENGCHEVTLPEAPKLMKTDYIQHLYTPVSGVSKEDTSLLQIVEHLHPTPALGGMPKLEALENIRETEELDRGFYAAPIGWLDQNGNGEFAVAIRSALIQGQEASLFAGCGIVENSDPESEYIETKIKFRPMLNALGGKIT